MSGKRAKIVAGAGKQPHTVALAARDDAKTVVLDLVDPARTNRRRFRQPRQAGFKAKSGLVVALNAPKLNLY